MYDTFITLTIGMKQKVRINTKNIVWYSRYTGDSVTTIMLTNGSLDVTELPDYIDGVLKDAGVKVYL